MKHHFANLILVLSIVTTFAASCRREYPIPNPSLPSTRSIKYILYTTEDFSDDQHMINFSLRISAKGRYIFDSALAPMRISEIPDKIHAIVVDKIVPPGFERDTLVVGFDYKVPDVGESWFIDTCSPTTSLKRVEFAFR